MRCERTLLLDQGYQPIKDIHWHKAISMIFKEKVDILSEHNWEIRAATCSFTAPSVIRLKDRRVDMSRFLKLSRTNIYARDRHICQYCDELFKKSELTFDHVVPKSFGGRTTWENIVTCCRDCNYSKADRTPQQASMRLIRKPKYPSHISLIDRYSPGSIPEDWLVYLGKASV